MKSWIVSIICIVVLSAIILNLLPDKRGLPLIKTVLGIIVILIIFNPILNVSSESFSFEYDFSFNQEESDKVFNKIKNLSLNNTEKNCIKILAGLGIENAEVKVEYLTGNDFPFEISNVKINLAKAVIKNKDEHIDIIEEVRSMIKNYLSVELSKVDVYG